MGAVELQAMTMEQERSRDMRPGEWWPWWVRYAEYDRHKIALVDIHHPSIANRWTKRRPRYGVIASDLGTFPCPRSCGCGHHHTMTTFVTDDLAEAEAAFETACEHLREERE